MPRTKRIDDIAEAAEIAIIEAPYSDGPPADEAGDQDGFEGMPDPLVRQKVAAGNGEIRRDEPMRMGETVYLIVELAITADGRKLDKDGLVYTAAGDARIREIDQHTYTKALELRESRR